MKYLQFIIFSLYLINFTACNGISQENSPKVKLEIKQSTIFPADYQIDDFLPLLKNKNIALVVNPSASLGKIHLVDTLKNLGVKIKTIFAPEHGFRGNLERGKEFNNQVDEQTGISVVSLFGKNKRPSSENLNGIDIVVFDIQDVGARFFTYISTMHLVMDACAENNIPFMVLDRPNPLGNVVDGPVRKEKFKSFVGWDPIPLVHGLTIGELAEMINNENWLECGKKCNLTVIKMKNYTHLSIYSPTVRPSPNLPNDVAIQLYPSLCLFEATNISIGRGTDFPFQVIGFPDKKYGNFTFTPSSKPGVESMPLHSNTICYGVDLRKFQDDNLFTLSYFIDFYKKSGEGEKFFANRQWFNLLIGNEEVAIQILEGKTEAEIKATWKTELDEFKKMRKKYLLYSE